MKNQYNIFDGDKKFHGDDHDLWSHCVYLGSHIYNGCEYDLGVYEGKGRAERGFYGLLYEVSFVIVYGKMRHQFIGRLIECKDEWSAKTRPMNSVQLCNAGPHDSYYERKCPLQMETLTRYRRYLSAGKQQHTTPNYDSRTNY
jgi:hypothetical protein